MVKTSASVKHAHVTGGKTSTTSGTHDHDVDMSGYPTIAQLTAAIANHEAKYHVTVPVPPTTTPDAPVGELKTLLDGAASGSVVNVLAKHYHEQTMIVVSKPLTINFAGDVSSDSKLGTLIEFRGPGIVVKNLTAIGASAAIGADQQGYVQFAGAGGAQVLDISVDGGPNAGLRLWDSPNIQVRVKEIKNAPVVGIIGWNSPGGRILDGGSVHHCGFRPDGNSGGIKIGGSNAGTALNFDIGAVECHHNQGRGAWYDVYAKNSGFTKTRTHHNSHNGLMIEIQDGGYMRGCVSYEDAWALKAEPWWGGGLLDSSSGNIEITGCIVAWCPTPIVAAGQQRTAISDGHAIPDLVNGYRNNIHDNLVAYTPGTATKPVNFWTDYAGAPMDKQDATTGNSYGVNNNVATAAQLAAAGIPAAPESH